MKMKRKPLIKDQSVLFDERVVFNPMTNAVTEHLTVVKKYAVKKDGDRRC